MLNLIDSRRKFKNKDEAKCEDRNKEIKILISQVKNAQSLKNQNKDTILMT